MKGNKKIMEMTLRWYGSKFDTVTLQQIRQIPGVTGVITTLYDTTPGEVWSREINTSIITLRHWKISDRKIFILYVITSCRYLTGQEQSLQE